ncbi:MAG TPA: hypothetical protein VFY10_03440 [Dehalococcoidia bacterium]|nr:hypothetical protein [Dehalococcoidia bacterium]
MADRIEREIEEILKKIDNFPDRNRPKARKPSKTSGALQRWLTRVSMRKVMMWALFVAMVAFFLRGIPGGYFLLIGAIIVFVTAFMLSTRGTGPANPGEKRWRGQPLDLSEPGWPDKVKAWIKGRKRA